MSLSKALIDKIKQYPKSEIKNAIDMSVNGVEIDLTAAQIIAFGTTPLEIVTGVAGVAYEVTDYTFIFDYGTTQFTGGGAVVLEDSANTARSATLAAAPILAAADSVTSVAGNKGTLLAGSGIYITNATAAFAAGDGVARLKLNYRTHVTGL
ncbi:MAG: hypothetical protein KUG64_10685 [Cycloclasticus sp.]|nr:hypothetical protein [Cycloclasticus sp.]